MEGKIQRDFLVYEYKESICRTSAATGRLEIVGQNSTRLLPLLFPSVTRRVETAKREHHMTCRKTDTNLAIKYEIRKKKLS